MGCSQRDIDEKMLLAVLINHGNFEVWLESHTSGHRGGKSVSFPPVYARLTAANTELRPYILSALHCDNSLEMVSQMAMVCSTVCSSADQRKHHSSASLAFGRGIHRWPVNSPDKGPVIRKMFPLDDVIMETRLFVSCCSVYKSFRNYMRSMSITDVFCEKFQQDLRTDFGFMEQGDFTRVEGRMRIRRISNIATPTAFHQLWYINTITIGQTKR